MYLSIERATIIKIWKYTNLHLVTPTHIIKIVLWDLKKKKINEVWHLAFIRQEEYIENSSLLKLEESCLKEEAAWSHAITSCAFCGCVRQEIAFACNGTDSVDKQMPALFRIRSVGAWSILEEPRNFSRTLHIETVYSARCNSGLAVSLKIENFLRTWSIMRTRPE